VYRSCEYLLKTQIRIVSFLLLEFINLFAGRSLVVDTVFQML
jgi:hypothetical protein